MASFRALAAGKAASVDVYVNVGSTEAKTRTSGIYEMTKAEFDAISADRIANAGRVSTLDEFLDALDDGAMGGRWIRLSACVAEWIDSKPPKIVVDESIF